MRKVEEGLSHMLHSLNPLGLRWSLVFLPWNVALRWVSICLSFGSELCAMAGFPPSGYVTKNQVCHSCMPTEAAMPKLVLQVSPLSSRQVSFTQFQITYTNVWEHRIKCCRQDSLPFLVRTRHKPNCSCICCHEINMM